MNILTTPRRLAAARAIQECRHKRLARLGDSRKRLLQRTRQFETPEEKQNRKNLEELRRRDEARNQQPRKRRNLALRWIL